MPHRRRRSRRIRQGAPRAGFTVPESADAADVSIALRRRDSSPYTLRLDHEPLRVDRLVMDWQRAA